MSEVFEVLSDREHTLKKAHIMVGSLAEEEYNTYINGKYTSLRVVPALLVIIREIIDNSIDEFARSGMTAATKIKITMDAMSLTVEDNGRGIPIERYINEENKIDEWRPVLCWTQLRAGTSFTNHTIGPSSNGVGSSVANILSLVFKGETWDGNNYCKVTCSDNMGNKAVHIEKKKHSTGTKVYIEPDFERFGVVGFTPDHIAAAKERIVALSSVYPEITFTFNGEKIRTKKAKEYLEVYEKPYVLCERDNYFFAIMPTELDEYYHQSYIDGLYVRNGGTHEMYVSRELSYVLRDLIKKKHKIDMSPAEIKRGFFLCFNARFFPSLKFDSQTKERLTNSEAEVKAYLGEVNFEKLAKDILNTPEIIEPIIEAKLAKQIAAEKRAITLEQKKMTKKYVEKHIPAKSKKVENTVLLLTEGDSAKGMLEKVRDLEIHGAYPMKGCVKNTYGVKDKEILENKELNDIMTILGLKFHMSAKEIKEDVLYGKIGILADGDLDGSHISSLVINFFAKWEELFHQKKVFIVTSPRYIFTKNKGKKNEERVYCYDNKEYEEVRDKYKGWELRYIKGLGSLRPKEYRDVLDMTDRWLCVELDDKKCLDIMFSSNVEERRKIMGI
jgi:DNA topoisomerase-2